MSFGFFAALFSLVHVMIFLVFCLSLSYLLCERKDGSANSGVRLRGASPLVGNKNKCNMISLEIYKCK
jgi:hypothetical protein